VSTVEIRRFLDGDEPALHAVFHSAIHGLACKDYTSEQIEAWAPQQVDPALWARRMRGIQPFVVVAPDGIAGYADVQASGYIDHFFVAARYARQGVGRLLMGRIHEEARTQGIGVLTSDVSRTAQAFFASFGFSIVGTADADPARRRRSKRAHEEGSRAPSLTLASKRDTRRHRMSSLSKTATCPAQHSLGSHRSTGAVHVFAIYLHSLRLHLGLRGCGDGVRRQW
jgi:putative acetyltransferase